MTDEERLRRNANPKVNELKEKISNKNSDRSYVFISYKSDDWEKVLTEIVYKLVNEYGLNIYYDGSFDSHNNSWIVQFPENMNSYKCRGVLTFLDNAYATSYATLMELMHSQTYEAGGDTGLPIVPVNLGDLYDLSNSPLGDEDTGLNRETFEDGTTNPNAQNEKKLFDKDYKKIAKKGKIDDTIYDPTDSYLNKKVCSKMVRDLLASKGYSINMYSNTNEFYKDLVNTIKDACTEAVFSTPSRKAGQSAEQTTPVPASAPEAASAPKPVSAPVPAPVPAPEPSSKNKKCSSTTGDITYTIYGKEYTDNQSNMMLNVFAKVLKKHPDAVTKILEDSEKPMIRCASAVNYELSENKTDDMPSRYLAGRFLDIGSGIFIGTALNYPEKLRNIAQLLTLCGEDFSVLQSEQIELPNNIKLKASGSGTENYTIYGEKHSGNQSQMMIDALKFIMEKHFDKREELADKLLSVKLAPMSELTSFTYFRSGGEFVYQGITYSIGTSFSRTDKLKQIRKAISICGEDITQFGIEGLNNPC